MSLEEMAKLVGLSQIKRAQELLLLGKESISAIAIQTGFADQSHFTKTFRRTTGATPKDWQRSRKL